MPLAESVEERKTQFNHPRRREGKESFSRGPPEDADERARHVVILCPCCPLARRLHESFGADTVYVTAMANSNSSVCFVSHFTSRFLII